MYRVVLADDERIIMQGLQKMIQWEELSLEVVGTANSGQELLDLIREVRPDIVISDIKMPGLTGLDVIEAMEGKAGSPRFIFISGFEEFSFAQKALSFGAVDYLLKPVMERDLEKALKKAVLQLRDQSTADIFREGKDEMQEFFQSINNGYEYAEQELYDRFKEAKLHPENQFFVGICFGLQNHFGESTDDMSFEKTELKRFVVYNAIQESFLESNSGFLTDKDNQNCNIMAMLPLEYRDRFVEEYLLPRKKYLEESYQVQLQIGVGTIVEDITQLIESYQTARFAYDMYFFEEKDVISYDSPEMVKPVELEELDAKQDQLFHSILTHEDNIMEQLTEILGLIRNMCFGNKFAAQSRIAQLITELLDRLDRHGLYPDSYRRDQQHLLKNVQMAATYGSIQKLVVDFFEEILPELKNNSRKNDDIIRAQKYILDHYMEDIDLVDISEIACMSQYYFSTMFKKVTGENYKAYLTRIRMEKALELVTSTNLKTYEIGEEVGYHNTRRFVESFKKEYGKTPADYKKQI